MNKKQLYETIMQNVSFEIKKILNEQENAQKISSLQLPYVIFHINRMFNEFKHDIRYWIDKLDKDYKSAELICNDYNKHKHIIKERLNEIDYILSDFSKYDTYVNSYDDYIDSLSYKKEFIVDKDTYEKVCLLYLRKLNNTGETSIFMDLRNIADLIKSLKDTIDNSDMPLNRLCNAICRKLQSIIYYYNKISIPIIDATFIINEINK